MPYTYDYPQASPCGALVGYTRNENSMSLMTTFRDASVGSGRSLTFGGFWEVRQMFDEPGKMRDGNVDLYREGCEELGEEFKTIIPYADFTERVEYLWDGMKRSRDTHFVNSIIQKSLELTQGEADAIMALGETSEQRGKKMETFLFGAYKDAAEAETAIRERLSDFKYPEEVDAAVRLYNKLNKAHGAQPQPLAA